MDPASVLEQLELLQGSALATFRPKRRLLAAADEPNICYQAVSSRIGTGLRYRHKVVGTGAGIDETAASITAAAEALERWCAGYIPSDLTITASACELGAAAVSPLSFPSCSDIELSDPRCPLRKPVVDKPLRWVKGLSLMTGKEYFLPVIAVYVTPSKVEGEHFLHPLSTGCAAHTLLEQAIMSATLEVVERDALSIAWLQRLRLPSIHLDDASTELGELWQLLRTNSGSLRFLLFNATTDLGIPCVYAVRRSSDQRLHTLVAAACALDARVAARKAIMETCAYAIWLRSSLEVPSSIQDFCRFHHGPLFMAQKSQAHAFDFLTDSTEKATLPEMNERSGLTTSEPSSIQLRQVVGRLRDLGHEAFVVNLTTREAHSVGMQVVRVVIPSLMPFSAVYRARFLGHPRLYNAPTAMNYASQSELHLNPYPQPFG